MAKLQAASVPIAWAAAPWDRRTDRALPKWPLGGIINRDCVPNSYGQLHTAVYTIHCNCAMKYSQFIACPKSTGRTAYKRAIHMGSNAFRLFRF